MSFTGLVLDDLFTLHQTPRGHPERASRYRAIREAIELRGLDQRCNRIEPRPVTVEELMRVHSAEYLHRLEMVSASGGAYMDSPESCLSEGSLETAAMAAGSVVEAACAVAEGRIKRAFCAVRPPGHHAEREYSTGFCFYNNIAVAAACLLEKFGFKRVAIVDWDVHHGNGTQHAFESEARVLFVSLHNHPDILYPGSGYENERGTGLGEGTTINITLPGGTSDAAYRAAFEERALPALEVFKPQFILISAGFDAHRSDPLGMMELESETFYWLTQRVCEIAKLHSEGRVLSTLEGGYELESLSESVCQHLQALIDEDLDDEISS